MLTISLHGIKTFAPVGLYAEEAVLGNRFETDVDIWLEIKEGEPWPFVDYVMIRDVISEAFQQPQQIIEALVQQIYGELKSRVGNAVKIRVAVRKYHLPVEGEINYAQVCFEA